MSWLFDRLTDLAVADHLTIVIDASFDPSDDLAAKINLATEDQLEPILCRARQLEGTSVWHGSRPPQLASVAESRGSRFVASGTADGQALFATLGDHDLGVSVGDAALGASVQVNAAADLASLLDALLTLRSCAQRAVA